MPTENEYSLADLADLVGVTPRTVRYYVAQGLLPSPGQVGPGARYTEGHLDRLRLIRRLQREHLPLAEIRARLEPLDDDAVADLLDEEPTAPAEGSAIDYIRTLLAKPAGTERGEPAGSPLPPGAAAAAPSLPPGRASLSPPEASGPAPSLLRRASFDRIAEVDEGLSPPPEPPPNKPPPKSPFKPPPQPVADRSQWDRVALTPDIELHVRRPLSRLQNKQVDRLIAIARELLEGDPS
jgi:DNA-binding transcriptional MerR regulator